MQGVSGTTFTLKPGTGAAVGAVVTYDAASRTATLDPSADLAANTQYTATLTGGASAIKGATGTPLATVSWTFTTAAPSPGGHHPADGDGPVACGQRHGGRGDGQRDGDLLRGRQRRHREQLGTFTLRYATSTGASVSATVTYDATSRVATLNRPPTLAVNTPYTATLTGGASAIRDAANNPLATVSWTFTTAAAPADTTAPTVTARSPSSNATRSAARRTSRPPSASPSTVSAAPRSS